MHELAALRTPSACPPSLATLLQGAELDVVFQPIRRLDTFKPFGFEVLGRACTPDPKRVRSPDVLLEDAHDMGLLLTLDRAWRSIAIERIAQGHHDPALSWFFNIDSRCVDDPDFHSGFTRAALDAAGIPDLHVVMELGERDPFLDRARMLKLMPRYEHQGFAIALDDLGAGHASLNRLVELRPHVAKLDKALIRRIDGDRYRLALVRALVRFAEDVGILLVAEGIELASELIAVQRLGVMLGQGYLLGRPTRHPRDASIHV